MKLKKFNQLIKHKKKNLSEPSFYMLKDTYSSVYDVQISESQILDVMSELEKNGYDMDYLTIMNALKGSYARGNVKLAVEFLMYLSEANELIVHEIEPGIELLGSENLNGVTCYLDALLFAMFAKTNCFEAMLFQEGKDPISTKLCTFIRLWVNMLRDGRLITKDIVSQLCDVLIECGWKSACKTQQDASEVYVFITERLNFPLLTFKVVIAHGGKFNSEEDHKYIHERLLCVPIPGDFLSYETPISLEECLSEYFNNRIKVKRCVEQSFSADSSKKGSQKYIYNCNIVDNDRNYYDQLDDFYDNDIAALYSQRDPPLVSAWQFFQLLPFYVYKQPDNLNQHFLEKLPVVTICLKRYTWTVTGEAYCNNRRVSIPLVLDLPYFISHEEVSTNNSVEIKKYRLVLQSVVCHRNPGFTIDSGHYIAFCKDSFSKKWFLFDDLAYRRVSVFCDPDEVLNSEMPYILFYQLESYVPDLSQEMPKIDTFKSPDIQDFSTFSKPSKQFNKTKYSEKNCLIQ